MRKIKLAIENMPDKLALHNYLMQILHLPDYYGKNLDALYDCLTEISEPLIIAVPAAATGSGYLQGYGVQLAATLLDAASDNENLKIVIE